MNRRKKIFIIFLCFLILFNSFFPVERAEAIGFLAALGIVGLIGGIIASIYYYFEKCDGGIFVCGFQLLFDIIHHVIWFINRYFLTEIIDKVVPLNPFKEKEEKSSPVKVLWNILVNIGYIVLSFSALFAGFQWLLGEDELAKRLIFNIILVALLINFSFVLVKESFNVVQAIERGITGGEYEVGKIIISSLWQKDPFIELNSIIQEKGIKGAAGNIFSYLFVIVFDMIIFITLMITLALVLVRYFLIIFLAGVSPLAFVSLAFPQFKGVLAEVTANFRKFDVWLGHFIRWLIILPIFIFLVLLGNLIKETTFTQITIYPDEGNLFEFVIVLLFMAFWYLLAIKFAVDLSNGVGALAKAFATATMLTVGGWAAGGLMMATSGKVGGFLSKMGGKISEKAGTGFFGARIKKFGEGIRKKGEGLIERRYKTEGEAVKIDMARYNEQLAKAKTEEEKKEIMSKITDLIKRSEENPYLLTQANEGLKKMSTRNFEKIATSEAASSLISSDAPLEIRETFNDKLGGISKETIKKIANDPKMMEIYKNASADVYGKFNDLVKEKLKEEDVLEIMQNKDVRDLLEKPEFEDFRNSLNIAGKGLLDISVSTSVEQISNVLSKMDKKFWQKTGAIYKLLKDAGKSEGEIQEILVESIKKSTERLNIIGALQAADPDDPMRQMLMNIPEEQYGQLLGRLQIDERQRLEAIRPAPSPPPPPITSDQLNQIKEALMNNNDQELKNIVSGLSPEAFEEALKHLRDVLHWQSKLIRIQRRIQEEVKKQQENQNREAGNTEQTQQ